MYFPLVSTRFRGSWAAVAALAFGYLNAIGAAEPKAAELNSLQLYVPIPELEHRVGSEIEPLTKYVKALENATAQYLQKQKRPQAKGLLIAVGIVSEKQRKIWCQPVDGKCPVELLCELEKVLAELDAIALKNPPMAFGMQMNLWGQKPNKFPQFPDVWIDAAKKSETQRIIPPDDLFKTLWPEAAIALTNKPAATELIVQMLEPIGGKIRRPKDWFYTESHSGPSYVWTLSREDVSKGPYTTGFRIQMLVGIKENTGKSPKEFVQDFIQKKKKEADKVLQTCDANKQELFTRICLETHEGPHHILYSFFWGNDNLDIAVVAIAGTTKELWNTYSAVFDQMAGFELIDATRFAK